MRLLATSTAVLVAAFVVAAPAQAHCPNWCSTGWDRHTAGELRVKATGPVTEQMIATAVQNELGHNSIENLIASATIFVRRTSSTSGIAVTFADYGFRWTPERITLLPHRYIHACQADWNMASVAYRVSVRCDQDNGWVFG